MQPKGSVQSTAWTDCSRMSQLMLQGPAGFWDGRDQLTCYMLTSACAIPGVTASSGNSNTSIICHTLSLCSCQRQHGEIVLTCTLVAVNIYIVMLPNIQTCLNLQRMCSVAVVQFCVMVRCTMLSMTCKALTRYCSASFRGWILAREHAIPSSIAPIHLCSDFLFRSAA